MKLRFLIPVLFLALSAIGQSRPGVLRANEADNSPSGYARLNSSGQLPGSILANAPSGGGGSTSNYVTNGNSYQSGLWELATLKKDGTSITDADCDSVLFIKYAGLYYKRFIIGRAQLEWWGAVPNDAGDDYPLLQKAINALIKEKIHSANIGGGKFRISQGLVVRRPLSYDANPNLSTFVDFSLYGNGNAYDADDLGRGSATQIEITSHGEACYYIQKGKGCEVSDIAFVGMNTGIEAFSRQDVLNETSNFVTNGCLNTPTAFDGGIVIDGFYTSSTTNKFTNKAVYYNEGNGAGSTGIKINNCYFKYFVVGIAISPGGMQNAEQCVITNPYVTRCRVGISFGDSQNRTNKIIGYYGWDKILYHFNGREYCTGGSGCPPTVEGFNCAGDTKYLVRLGNWYGNTMMFRDGHTELMSYIGGCFEGLSTQLYFDHCQLYFTGDLLENGYRARIPNQIAQADEVVFDKCLITYYGHSPSLFGITAHYVTIANSIVSDPFNVNLGSLTYTGTTRFDGQHGTAARLLDMSIASSTNQNVTITSVDNSTGVYTFTDGTATVQAGAYVLVTPKTSGQLTGEYTAGNVIDAGAGTVQSVNSTTHLVTAKGLPAGFAAGQNVDLRSFKYTPITP